jgi:hypothetical protein
MFREEKRYGSERDLVLVDNNLVISKAIDILDQRGQLDYDNS